MSVNVEAGSNTAEENFFMNRFGASILGFSFLLAMGTVAQPVSSQEIKRIHFAVSTPVHYLPSGSQRIWDSIQSMDWTSRSFGFATATTDAAPTPESGN
jgi:hypothetical protein